MSTKKLATQTVIYGASSIVGRLLNWLLVPLYTYVFVDTGEMGIISNLYGYAAFLLILLTFGMETTYFRFVNNPKWDRFDIYGTYSTVLLVIASLFFLFIYTLLPGVSHLLGYDKTPQYILIFAGIIALDILLTLPFARLRKESRPFRFAGIKLANIAITITCNLYFLLWMGYGIEYVFWANLIGSGASVLLLLPYFRFSIRYNPSLCKQTIKYASPLVIIGFAGLIPQNGYTVLFQYILPNEEAQRVLGEFAPNFKLGVIMALFTQSFRYAFEPYFFSKNKEDANNKKHYAKVLNYFVLIGLALFVLVSLNINFIVKVLGENYRTQNRVIPFVFMGFLIMGMNYTISLWYKLTDKTYIGAILNTIGAVVYVILFCLLFAKYGTIGVGIAFLASQIGIFFSSYIWSRRYYAVPYQIGKVWLLILCAMGLIYWHLS